MNIKKAASIAVGCTAFMAIITIALIVQAAYIKLYPKGDFYE